MNRNKKVLLVVLDGWGYREEKHHNAIAEANTPYFDSLWQDYPHSVLEASGEAVGLPKGQMGNSEVGHTIIGAGKVVYTDFAKISKAAREKEFEKNPAFIKLFEHIKKYNSTLHIKGLIGEGGVHSHSNHLFAFLEAAKKAGISKVAIHAFTDGRDTPPQSAAKYLEELERVIEDTGIGFIATASGRFYAMDRDNNWDRLQKVESAIFDGNGAKSETAKPSAIIRNLYKAGIFDEHIEPIIFLDDEGNDYPIKDNDGIFFFNFRKDRARMLSQKIIERKESKNLCFVTMTEYDKNFDCLVAFPPEEIRTTLAREISLAGLSQTHIAETEKFAHATYYLNGGKQEPYDNEEHILIESRKDIKTHDEAPEMRAEEIADETFKAIKKDKNFIFVNFANPDMIGHTANKSALIQSLEKLDCLLQKLVQRAVEYNYEIILTADHGNAEVIFDEVSGQKHTAHTINPVPFIYIGKKYKDAKNGNLSDVAPTALSLLGIELPAEMTGKNLLR